MHHFRYVGQNLQCENVDLAEIARLYGTPTYVYSSATMADNYTRLADGLKGLDLQICYAMKANSSLAILRHFANLGAGFDLVSGGEIQRVLAAGGDIKRSVFAGVGKTEAEIKLALENGIFAFHVESEPEIARINHVAGKLGVKAPIAIRINPDVDAHTHAKITTGKSDNKFGIPLAHAAAAYETAARFPHIQIKGAQMHIGSQLTSLAPPTGPSAAASASSTKTPSPAATPPGGAPSRPRAARSPPRPMAKRSPRCSPPSASRSCLSPAATSWATPACSSRASSSLSAERENFLIVDAAMNDLVRPAMYDSFHEIVPLRRDSARAAITTDIVGPVCESGDCFAKDRQIQEVGEGEFIALLSAGAYGFTMASRYNTRSLAAEVLVKGAASDLINARETFAQQIQN
ncbi:MAG: diaminopimelate decarboxylase, partial [Opitutaceae bacterium]|nr:diaminopimelate decarboxylase [Opitutaceae bacterium]